MMKECRKNRNQKGQALIELLVAIGLAAVLITALVNLANATTRRTTVSRQANQASKLAQEGMEIIRHIRDNNFPNATSGFGCTDNTWSGLYTCDWVGDVTARLSEEMLGGTIDSYKLTQTGLFETINLGTGRFDRRIILNDDVSECNPGPPGPDIDFSKAKQVTVEVSWDSPTGNPVRRAVTCITKWH